MLFELTTGNVPFQGNDIEALQNNILKLKISCPRDINTDVKNLIIKILKLDPNSRLPLSDMLQHPFFTRYFLNAAQSLIKPDDNIKYKPFVASKDDPKTWDPIIKVLMIIQIRLIVGEVVQGKIQKVQKELIKKNHLKKI